MTTDKEIAAPSPQPVPTLPDYLHGLTSMESSQQKPLIRMINKLLLPKMRGLKKGLVPSQQVKLKHKKRMPKYW